MINEYNTVFGECENLTVIERSKFICNVKGIENEEQAKAFIDEVRKRQSLANHHCYAYIADENGLIMKFSDDGEPQGTAGLPMLEVLKNKKIHKTVAVVTRYFGGIKLGTGGLTRAYSGAVNECLNKSDIKCQKQAVIINLISDYENYKNVLKLITSDDFAIISTDFGDNVKIKLAIKSYPENVYENFLVNLSNIFRGKHQFEVVSKGYFPFKV